MGAEDIITTQEGAAASPDVRTGYLSGPGFVDEPVRFSVVDGIALFQGCIDMGPVAEVEQRAATLRAQHASAAEAADTGAVPPPDLEMKGIGLPSTSQFLWTNGVVPFVIDGGLPDPGRVNQAINHIHENTPIRFVARTTHANYIRFIRNPNANWSSSPIGMRGGEQVIRLSDGANVGVIVHECLHSLGILHEQSRCDRDQYVQIKWENIQAGFESNFDKFCPAQGFVDYFEYDYGSIMHYGATSFSKNGQPTIVALKSGVTMGQRNGLTFNDRLTIAHMYARFFGTGHTGVWRTGSGAYGLWVNSDWDTFKTKWQEWAGQGLRLVDIDVRRAGTQDRYSGVWLAGTGAYGLWVNASWDSFVAKWREWGAQGLRLVDLHVQKVGTEVRYSGVWRAGAGAYALWGNASWDSFVAKWREWAGQGLRLVDINVANIGGVDRYTGVWQAGAGGYGLWANASKDAFVAKWKEWANQGLRLVDVCVHQVGGQNRYSGCFLPGNDAYYFWTDVPWESFRAKWQQLGAQGLRLIDYEFTTPAFADAAGLDIDGSPVQVADGDAPAAFGGIFGEDGQLVDGTAAKPAMITADGAGGLEEGVAVVAAGPASSAGTDGMGDAVLDTASASAAAGGDGMGEAVLDVGVPAAAAAGGDGQGGASLDLTAPVPPADRDQRAMAAQATNGG